MMILDKHRDALKKFLEIYGNDKQIRKFQSRMARVNVALHEYEEKFPKCKTEDERKELQKEVEESFGKMLVIAEQIKLIFDENNISMYADKEITKQKEKLFAK